MPPIRVAQHARPAPVEPQHAFAFPKDHHLVITTETNVWSWDHRGLTNAFGSGSGGILAAKEAKDGSGLLAVADDQVVVLHDATRGMDRSYRLKGTDGQVRLLEYSNDSKSLFFTTTLQNAVQSYSLRQSCLLEPSHTHPSPPTVLAISSTSHLLLSASERPPTIFLQNLTLRTPALQLQPRASSAAVETASFHPERPNVFLLAFKDGSLAAYDATRILGKAGRGGSGGEVGRFKNLHTVTNRVVANSLGETGDNANVTGGKSVSITSASFLPGHRSRAVSVGADGRCRLVDFECGGNILRTWHAKGPATSLSVLSVRQKQAQVARTPANRAEASAPNNTLAVGREDGKVLVFDSVGILLSEQTVDATAGRILDVEWMKGPGLKPDTKSARSRGISEAADSKDRRQAKLSREDEPLPGIAPDDDEEEYTDEDSGTVNRNPVEVPEKRPAVNAMNYMDLFSPVKPSPKNSPQRRSPRPRARPRILSSTFRQSSSSHQMTPPRLSIIPQLPRPDEMEETCQPEPEEKIQLQQAAMRNPPPIPKSPSKLPSPSKRSGSPRRAPPSQEIRIAKTPSGKTPRARKSRRVSARMPTSFGSLSTNRSTTSTFSSNNKILADIRRLGDPAGDKKTGLALFAPYMNIQKNTPRSALSIERDEKAPKAKPESSKRETATPADDIWLTSDEEPSASHVRSRGKRQASQRRRINQDTFIPPSASQPPQWQPEPSYAAIDSGNDENTANVSPRQSLSPDAAIRPGDSLHLQEHFPRTSSLSHRHSGSGRKALGDLEYNAVHSPRPRHGRKSGLIASELMEALHGAEEQSENSCDCGKGCCAALRKDFRDLSEELRMLREEMAEMRMLMGR
ncbi:hypothetical protein MPH_08896 [Macrophomina phaseolina MS6]|uniref:WD40 repeat-like protein n=1 Tax=Macrophomina phaseolina (strain MS6) TaxID=1126212 RepID=K2RM57_MACPH|nr:hypothetical protein MPH_08896 [Macrophomina phaseolina MS6]